METTYEDMPEKIRARVPFKGNSVTGVWVSDTMYAVVSYGTIIATWDNEVVWVDPQKYSKTTSRIQNMVKTVWGVSDV